MNADHVASARQLTGHTGRGIYTQGGSHGAVRMAALRCERHLPPLRCGQLAAIGVQRPLSLAAMRFGFGKWTSAVDA